MIKPAIKLDPSAIISACAAEFSVSVEEITAPRTCRDYRNNPARDAAMTLTHRLTDQRLRQLRVLFGSSPTSISKAKNRVAIRMRTDKGYAASLGRVIQAAKK